MHMVLWGIYHRLDCIASIFRPEEASVPFTDSSSAAISATEGLIVDIVLFNIENSASLDAASFVEAEFRGELA